MKGRVKKDSLISVNTTVNSLSDVKNGHTSQTTISFRTTTTFTWLT